jgi:hypothetical protein
MASARNEALAWGIVVAGPLPSPSEVSQESQLRFQSWTSRTACRRRGNSTVPDRGANWRSIHGSAADRVTSGEDGFWCVTTRRRNHRILNGLRPGLDSLVAHFLCLGAPGFGKDVLAIPGSPPPCRPLANLPPPFRMSVVVRASAPGLVLAPTPFAFANRPAQSAPPDEQARFPATFRFQGEAPLPKGILGEDVEPYSRAPSKEERIVSSSV